MSKCYPLDIYIRHIALIKYNDLSKCGYHCYNCDDESTLRFCNNYNYMLRENPQIVIHNWTEIRCGSHKFILEYINHNENNKDNFFLKVIMDSLLEYGSDGFTIPMRNLNNEIRTIYTLCRLFNMHISLTGTDRFLTYMISAVNKN